MRATFVLICAMIVVTMSLPTNSKPDIKPAAPVHNLEKRDIKVEEAFHKDVEVMEEEVEALDEELGHSVEKREADEEVDEDDDDEDDDEDDNEEEDEDNDDDE